MTNSTRSWVWGGVAVLVVLVGVWLWYQAQNSNQINPVGYGTPAASSTGALKGPTTPIVVENRTSTTVAGIIQNLQNGSRFSGLLANTGVSATLTGKGPYTVFVPTDASFGILPAGTVNNLSAAELKRLVQYHIISGKMIDVNLQVAGTVPALSKDALNFSYEPDDKSARVNSGKIVAAYKASNGVVYVISAVLLPPLPPQN
ncbi:fasciclin domain-containing protein [Patescibacteria group bacterium]|nr:fasciclin domain-containing protein [Patescibacteria group bacterium]